MSKPRGNRIETQRRITETTLRLIEEKGYVNTTTNDVAIQSGVSIALVYKYYPKGKPDILKAITKNLFDEFESYNLTSYKREDLPLHLKAILNALMASHRRHEAVMQATAIAMLTSREAFSEATQIESGEKALTPIIKRILIDSGINEGRVDEVSRLLLYTVDGLIHRQVLYGGVASSDQKLVDFLVDLVLGYIDRRRD